MGYRGGLCPTVTAFNGTALPLPRSTGGGGGSGGSGIGGGGNNNNKKSLWHLAASGLFSYWVAVYNNYKLCSSVTKSKLMMFDLRLWYLLSTAAGTAHF